jgi:ureidoacrylate peracid hydrolase
MDLSGSALILIDFQNDVLHPDGPVYRRGLATLPPAQRPAALANAARLVERFARAGRPVIWVNTILRPDHLDSALAPATRDEQGLTPESGFLAEGSWGAEVLAEVQPPSDALVVVKKGHSAFQFTPLDRLLSNLGVDTCLTLGAGGIDSLAASVRQGGALGYEMGIAVDATGYPPDAAYLRNLWNRAVLTTTDEALAALATPAAAAPREPRTALLLIDLQNDFVHPEGAQHRLGHNTRLSDADREQIVRNNQRLLRATRAAGNPVVFTMTVHRDDMLDSAAPPIGPRNKPVPPGQDYLRAGTWGAQVLEALVVEPDDFVITKKGRSAFGFTPLHRILRNVGARRCIVTGGGIHGCVEDTIREGVGLGYAFTVATDAIYEPNSPNLAVMADQTRFETTDAILGALGAADERARARLAPR